MPISIKVDRQMERGFVVIFLFLVIIAAVTVTIKMLANNDEKMIAFGKKPSSEKMIPIGRKEGMVAFGKKLDNEKMIPIGRKEGMVAFGRKSADSFGQKPSTAIKKEFARSIPSETVIMGETVIKPPPGVQPGTLVAPPVGEVQVAPLYDSKYGFNSNFVFPYTVSRSERITGRPMATRNGTKSEGQSGVSVFSSKEEASNAVMGVVDMFDELFTERIFPGAQIEQNDGNYNFKVTWNGKCVILERYYEYVGACIAKEVGVSYPSNMHWADGSNLQLGFDFVDSCIPILQDLLVIKCDNMPGYTILQGGEIQSNMTGNIVEYTIRWPADNTVIVNHKLILS